MDAAHAASLVAGGYAAVRYLRRLTVEIVDDLDVPCRIDPATNTIMLSLGRDDDFDQYLRAAIHQLLDGRTVVEYPDGTIGLSPGRVTADGVGIVDVTTPPRLRVV
ncbi:hypothetical protein [Saccharothrix stipae]